MASLTLYGARRCVGNSAALLRYNDMAVLVDYGANVSYNPPAYPDEIVGYIDYVFLTHAHFDHTGASPSLIRRNDVRNICATPPTKDLAGFLFEDAMKINVEKGIDPGFNEWDVRSLLGRMKTVEYGTPISLGDDMEAVLFDAGHIPGSAMVNINVDGKNVLFTGDYNTMKSRLVGECKKDMPVDVLVTEGTYSDRDHPDRETQERELLKIIEDTYSKGGTTVIPVFGVARGDELILALDHLGVLDRYPVFLDGMAKRECEIIKRHPKFLRDHKKYLKALEKVQRVESYQRKHILRNPSVVLTTSGMLNGGPVMWYLKGMRKRKNSSVVLTGYQVKGTPGRTLLETGFYINKEYRLEFKAEMLVRQLDFSGHLGKKELDEIIRHWNPEKIILNHGDRLEEYAQELADDGFYAVAPSDDNKTVEI